MEFIDWILVFVIAAIAGLAIWYVVKSKKRGSACIGCPHGGKCGQCDTRCQSGPRH